MKCVGFLTLAAVLLLISNAWSQSPGSPIPEEKRIVPGQRIGNWSLESTIDELKMAIDGPYENGPPDQLYSPSPAPRFVPGMIVHRWKLSSGTYARQLRAGSLDGRKIEYLEIDDESFRAGAQRPAPGPGSLKDSVVQFLGPPTSATPYTEGGSLTLLVYDRTGLAISIGCFAIGNSRSCNANWFAIFRPGAARSIWR